jgi:hypothetical protein
MNKIKKWYYRLLYRFYWWRLNRATRNLSKSIGDRFIPAMKDTITAINELMEAWNANTL